MNAFFFQTEFKPRKALCRTLTQDEEDDVVTWLRENTFEPRHDKTNKMSVRPAKTQISLGIRPLVGELIV